MKQITKEGERGDKVVLTLNSCQVKAKNATDKESIVVLKKLPPTQKNVTKPKNALIMVCCKNA